MHDVILSAVVDDSTSVGRVAETDEAAVRCELGALQIVLVRCRASGVDARGPAVRPAWCAVTAAVDTERTDSETD